MIVEEIFEHSTELIDKLACMKCSRPFGVCYEEKHKIPCGEGVEYEAIAQESMITGGISTASIEVCWPITFVGCKHHICPKCLHECEVLVNQNTAKCCVCQDEKLQRFEMNLRLLGQAMIEMKHNSNFTHLNFDINIKTRFQMNTINPNRIKADLGKFFLQCHHCIDNNTPDMPVIQRPVSIYCYHCTGAYCQQCCRQKHDNPALIEHHVIPIESISITNTNCSNHKNKLQYYSEEQKRFICPDCIIRDELSGKFIEIYSKRERIDLITNYKKEFRDCEVKIQNSLERIKNDITKLQVPDNIPTEKKIHYIIATKNQERARQLINEESELLQSLCVIDNVVEELNQLSKNMDNLLVNQGDLGIEQVLNEYLRLIATIDNPYKQRQLTKSSHLLRAEAYRKQLYNSDSLILPRPLKMNMNESRCFTEYMKTSNQSMSMSKLQKKNLKKKQRKLSQRNGKLNSELNESELKSAPSTTSILSEVSKDSKNSMSRYKIDINNNLSNLRHRVGSNFIGIMSRHSLASGKNSKIYDSGNSFTEYETEYYSESEEQLTEIRERNSKEVEQVIDINDKKLEPGFIGACTVINCENYSNIWIRFNRDNAALNLMYRQLKLWCEVDIEENRFTVDELKSISVGDIIGVYYKNVTHSVWSRARVTLTYEDNFHLFLIDLAIPMVNIKSSDVKKLKPAHLKVPPLAHRCYMDNLMPYEEDCETDDNVSVNKGGYTWPQNARLIGEKWCQSRNLEAHIKSINGNSYYGIDLLKRASDFDHRSSSLGTDYSCNISSKRFSNVLLRTRIAMHVNASKDKYEWLSDEDVIDLMPKYVSMRPLYCDQSYIAGVSHFLKFNEFYMRQLYEDNDADIAFQELKDRMQTQFEKSYDYVFDPVPGMPVAALFKDENMWYRAQIIKIHPGEGMVDVFFIDYGNIDTVSLLEIRYLNKENFVQEVSVFRVQLFGIKFYEDKLQEASDFFYEKMSYICNMNQKVTQVLVKNVFIDSNAISIHNKIYEVIIRFPIKEKLTNFNILVAKLDYANANNPSIYDGEKEPIKKDHNIKKDKGFSKLEIEATEVSKLLPDKVLASTPDTKILCRVMNAISPSEIWVQDVADADDGFYAKFQTELCEKYTKIYEDNEVDVCKKYWKVNDLCVIKTPNKRNSEFFRAKIIKKSDQLFTVVYLDNGSIVNNIESPQIFKLIDEFMDKPEFKAKKCRLVGIHPAGTTNGEWGHSANCFTSEHLNDQYVYIDFKSDKNSDDSYDSTIYIDIKAKDKNTHQVVNTNLYICFDTILSCKGLGFPDEKKQSLDRIIHASKSASRSTLDICPIDSSQSYIINQNLPGTVNPNKLYERLHDVLITHVNHKTGEIFVQFYKDKNTQRVLAQMQYDFKSFYRKEAVKNYKFTSEFIKYTINFNIMRRNQSKNSLPQAVWRNYDQACVCEINDRFYRCTIASISENLINSDRTLVQLIDYGDQLLVNADKIYRPVIKYLKLEPQAFRCKINVSIGNELKENYTHIIQKNLYNELSKLKIDKIFNLRPGLEYLIFEGDLFDKSVNSWCSMFLSNLEIDIYDDDEVFDTEQGQNEYKPTEFPPKFDGQALSVFITWDDPESRLVWLQLSENLVEVLSEEDETSVNIKEFQTMQDSLNQTKELRCVEIENIAVNMPCLSKYEDGLYRALIEKVDFVKNIASLYYVDYGNSDQVDLDMVYELNEKYLRLPVHSMLCYLADIRINKSELNEFLLDIKKLGHASVREILKYEHLTDKFFAVFKRKESRQDSDSNSCLSSVSYSSQDSQAYDFIVTLIYNPMRDEPKKSMMNKDDIMSGTISLFSLEH